MVKKLRISVFSFTTETEVLIPTRIIQGSTEVGNFFEAVMLKSGLNL
jgi:hypothetical protein